MQGKLRVKNFGVLKDIEININDFTIIIGSQAQGKSLIAKLIYFFKNLDPLFYDFIFQRTPENLETKFTEPIKIRFLEIFPDYLIRKFNKFEITFYYSKNSYIKISKSNINILKISLFGENEEKISAILNYVDRYLPLKKASEFSNNRITERMLSDLLSELKIKYIFSSGVGFIPAGRTYFSSLAKNIFSLVNMNVQIDKLLLQFGSYFDFAKGVDFESFLKHYDECKPLVDLMEEVLCGKYKFENQEAWIENEIGKIKLNDSSSGQQELLPMILVLFYNAIFTESMEGKYLIIIEEPEAHLFPKSQYKITEFFVLLHKISKKNPSFFITTHSPYILSSLNNLIQANNTYQTLKKRKKVKSGLKKIEEIIPRIKWLDYENVSAYFITDGKAEDIMNRENKLIDANKIDEISNVIANQFSKLLELEFGD